MRDPQRLDEMYNKLLSAHKQRLDEMYNKMLSTHKSSFSDWRLGQFLLNFLGWVSKKIDPFFPEDDVMMKYLEQFANGDKEPHDDRERKTAETRKRRSVQPVQGKGQRAKRVQKNESVRGTGRAKRKVQGKNHKS